MHSIQIVIGKPKNLEIISKQLNSDSGITITEIIPTTFDLAIGPVFLSDGSLLSSIDFSKNELALEEFQFLTKTLLTLIKNSSDSSGIGWVETECHGGSGDQWAALWHSGNLSLEPLKGDGSINKILSELGVPKSTDEDEFTSLGLGQVRQNNDFKKT